MATYEPSFLPPNAEEQDFIQAYENVREKYKGEKEMWALPRGEGDVGVTQGRRRCGRYQGEKEMWALPREKEMGVTKGEGDVGVTKGRRRCGRYPGEKEMWALPRGEGDVGVTGGAFPYSAGCVIPSRPPFQ
ncbi:hypothetical protein NHX12_002012 [Muraenolepis orangiensis]|uniref:Uncharacterized protein n=1 Tax=Muraenolepis orangiensis TaxID=630683 RepID=A0A9Q0E387_9TELE|nr:hypothetical protein NHX12_002012 [Muraenolepis orangiensis]